MNEKIAKAGAFLYRSAFRRSPARAAVSSFGMVILFGTFLLTLPISSRAREWTALVDALFTATSAVCVTGLLVKSTPDHWSLFGQLVILTMIQIGGLGIMTLGAFLAIMVQRRLSMRFEAVMTNIVEAHPAESVWTLIRFICLFTLTAEVLGAVLLFLAWRSDFETFWPCFYHSVFHAISAFCNAGFSLNNDSLMRYVDSLSVSGVVCALIVVGGIGFIVVRDLAHHVWWWVFRRRGKRPRLTTHSKLVLTVTGVLLAVGFLVFLIIESHGMLTAASPRKRLLAAAFQSVTPRTAGFNTVDIKTVAPSTLLLLMVLMYIGGSPGGTAGGVKTSTIGVMIASIVATLKGRNKAHMFHHSVPEEVSHRVASIILLSVAALATGVFFLLITEEARFQNVMFDAISAFGTVGLSTGLTGPDTMMSASGKLIITTLMFVGRLGPITLVLSVAQLRERAAYRLPEEQVLVG
ncbi:MAG: TrkH family potassium uptake protein [Planctomycetota bacterium]|jgi:trk system potassium uptake protein TrkH